MNTEQAVAIAILATEYTADTELDSLLRTEFYQAAQVLRETLTGGLKPKKTETPAQRTTAHQAAN